MAISKVTYAGNTLIDLTEDTVTPENLLSGATAHAANGEEITGIVEDKKGELEAQIADLRNQISSLNANLANKLYPVGSIYMSVNATNPAALFGGTWEQIKDQFLLAAGDTYAAGSTGGEATHTLTVDEMPSHRHSSDTYSNGYASSTTDDNNYCTWVNRGTIENNNPTFGESGYVRTSWVGGSQPHNNMPPYLAVYMWQRTA